MFSFNKPIQVIWQTSQYVLFHKIKLKKLLCKDLLLFNFWTTSALKDISGWYTYTWRLVLLLQHFLSFWLSRRVLPLPNSMRHCQEMWTVSSPQVLNDHLKSRAIFWFSITMKWQRLTGIKKSNIAELALYRNLTSGLWCHTPLSVPEILSTQITFPGIDAQRWYHFIPNFYSHPLETNIYSHFPFTSGSNSQTTITANNGKNIG
jgi:hypothetical protein